jgi:large subunit ribosomal protein L3
MRTPLAKAMLGRKLGMTQRFDEVGAASPVTVIQVLPCVVMNVSREDGAGGVVQIAFEPLPEKKAEKSLAKPQLGEFRKAGTEPHRYIRRFRLADVSSYEAGQKLAASLFEVGCQVRVTGVSKGKGFTGTVKRYGFSRGPMTHGSMSHRRPASGGATAPARVVKGTGKPGRMGAVAVTVKGLRVVEVDNVRNLLMVLGSVPGPTGGVVVIAQPTQPRERRKGVKVVE